MQGASIYQPLLRSYLLNVWATILIQAVSKTVLCYQNQAHLITEVLYPSHQRAMLWALMISPANLSPSLVIVFVHGQNQIRAVLALWATKLATRIIYSVIQPLNLAALSTNPDKKGLTFSISTPSLLTLWLYQSSYSIIGQRAANTWLTISLSFWFDCLGALHLKAFTLCRSCRCLQYPWTSGKPTVLSLSLLGRQSQRAITWACVRRVQYCITSKRLSFRDHLWR